MWWKGTAKEGKSKSITPNRARLSGRSILTPALALRLIPPLNMSMPTKESGDRVQLVGRTGGRPDRNWSYFRSRGLIVDEGKIEVSNRGKSDVAVFGPLVTPPDLETDNPVVVDSVSSPALRHTGDFQVTPSGDYAAFT